MAKNLVIVESPAKAKTIEKYLGKDYEVKSSFGHIRDLPKKGLNIDIAKNFEPTYEISPDKTKTVSQLKSAQKNKDVWLATDEDREGEAIAWHLTQALKLDPKTTKRIVFHEITKSAIERAVANPRTIDINLVDAQQARRILDRLVGYELSPVLWKKVGPGLSAGRVQSVAVRLILERERAIRDFKPAKSFKTIAIFKAKAETFSAELEKNLDAKETAKKFLEDCIGAKFSVKDISEKPGTRSPSPPFTTSSLQQEAYKRLVMSVKQTMTLAQRLYENGHITYMRTDSMTLSSQAIGAISGYVKKEFGDKYLENRQYKTKTAGAQEAHEAIRPTDVNKREAGNDGAQQKLYQLIWRRAIASQMAKANLNRTEAVIDISTRDEIFKAKGEVLTFDGFYKVYGGGKEDVILPKLTPGDSLTAEGISSTETYSRAPARYTEASLVKKLEELGIGRPSTYAPTISTIQTRGYVEKADIEGEKRQVQTLVLKEQKVEEKTQELIVGADKNKLVPTFLAERTTDFLVKYFSRIVDYDFTARVEEDFDNIEAGKQAWADMLKAFYKDFHPLVEGSDKVSRKETSQARELGKDPKTGKPVLARFGRYGPIVQLGDPEEGSDEKPIFAPLPEGTTLDSVTLDQALEMLKLPRTVGKTADGREITANFGRFGPYVQVEKLYAPIKPLDPLKITEAQAREAIIKKEQQEKNKYIQKFDSGINIVNGPYGPYITDGKKNARIPKDKDPKQISEEKAKKLLDEAPVKRSRFRKKK